jgi:DnaJ-domain-containing protein 1
VNSLLDRFERLLHSFLSSDPTPAPEQDPDFREAWRELDDYLQSGSSPRSRRADRRTDSRSNQQADPRAGADDRLRRDYANLEVPFGTQLAEVTRAYRKLLKRYHPDKFASDPEKQRLATEITQRINSSFQNIKETLRGKP